MDFKKVILYIGCVALLMIASKTFWELINFNYFSFLHSHSESIAYKGGYLIGMTLKPIGYVGLAKFIYNRFLKIKTSRLA